MKFDDNDLSEIDYLYRKAVLSFYITTALKYDEVSHMDFEEFTNAYFFDLPPFSADEKLKLLGMYNSDRSKCPNLSINKNASKKEKISRFYKWIMTDEAISYFQDVTMNIKTAQKSCKDKNNIQYENIVFCQNQVHELLQALINIKELYFRQINN